MTLSGPGIMVTLNELIAKLRVIFADDNVDVDEVMRAMESYKSNKADWRHFAVFDEHKYTRNLVDVGNGKYNLMILCWGPGMGSSIHDHTDSHCFVKILDGTLLETRYDWPEVNDNEAPMRKSGVNRYEENGVSYMSGRLIYAFQSFYTLTSLQKQTRGINTKMELSDKLGLHRMENPSHSDSAVSLHLYIPAYETCNAFDERTGKKTKCQVTFFTKYGCK
ncbi:unnamed protein product, partial [Strongylus vulgaris]